MKTISHIMQGDFCIAGVLKHCGIATRSASATLISSGQEKVQFSTLMQVPGCTVSKEA
jgi:hypothetical protein